MACALLCSAADRQGGERLNTQRVLQKISKETNMHENRAPPKTKHILPTLAGPQNGLVAKG